MSSSTEITSGALPEPRAESTPTPAAPGPAAVPAPARRLARPSRSELAEAVAQRFRMPGHDDPDPGPRRLAVVTAWAGTLGLGGVLVALRLMVNLFLSDGGWYRPTVIAIGLIGLLATVGAFISIHRKLLPWIMLGIGTAALLASFMVTAMA